MERKDEKVEEDIRVRGWQQKWKRRSRTEKR